MSILRKSKILCVLMVVALLATIIAPIGSFTAFAGEVGTYGDFEYSMSDFEVTITGYVGIEDYLTIPSEINGDPVVAIGESAFYDCDTLVGVVMPESVTMVGTEAFCDCTSLESVDMPGVTVINSYAFGDCYSLREVNMPRIEIINEDCFSYCDSLTDILVADDNEYFSTQDGVLLNKSKTVLVLYPSGKPKTSYTAPDSVLEIGKNAFFGNETLKTVNLPNVIALGTSAFDSCSYIETITMPNVETVGYEAFDYCHTLKAVDIPKANSIDTYAFYQCDSLKYVNIPKVTTIGYEAFYGCTALESIAMPSVLEIGEEVFLNCESLVMVDMPRVKGIETDAFAGCHDDLTIYAPTGTYAQTYAENHSINFVATNSTYGDFTYYRTGGEIIITSYTGEGGSVTIPEEIESYPVTTIGDSAFMYCDGLIHITMLSVTTIEDYAFADCVNLLSATMPEVITLGDHAFDSCENLETATMPKVVTIGYEAFDYCHALKEADIPNATTIDTYAFYECIALESVNMPKVTEIGEESFYCCISLTSVDMPELRMLGEYAFDYCTALESVSMPKATIIGEGAFEDCESLKDVIMPAAEQIYFGVFSGCPSTLTIWGYADTFAEFYANENGYNFSPLNAHTVNFYVEGVITCTQSVMENDFAVEIASPSKEGQYFLGWYTEGGEYYWFDTPVTEDINLYAKFGYYVAIYLDENDTEPVGWMSVEAGQCAEEPEAPGKEGKVFVGWYTEGGTKYDFSTPVTSDINIYAKFVDESAEWVKSVSHSISDGKIYFTVITAPGPYNRVKLTAADDKGGYIAYTNSYTVNSDGDYVWTIKTTAPASTTDYAFDARSSETGKYLKDYYDYTTEIATGIKSVSHEITGGKLVFTVITGAADFNRVKVSLASDLGSYLAYTNTYTVNTDGDYVWTIRITPPSSPEDYSFDIRSASTGKYLKDYYNYSVSVIPTIKSVSHEIVDTKIVFTVVTKPGNFNRIKVTLADNLGGSLGVASDYTVNANGDYVWTVKAAAPTVATDYAFDLRSSETSKYTKDYGYYSVTEIPVVKAISYTISNGKIFFTVITEPGNFARMKVTTADNLGGSLGVATTYTVNADGNYVWMLKAPEPTTDTTYAVDLRDAATGKYMKDYYYCEAQAKEPTILSATHEIVGDKVIFTVVTKAGSYDRIKVALATSLGTSLAVSTSYTVDSDGNYVWTVKTTAPTAETTYAFDLRASGGKYLKDYSYYDVEM